MVMRATGPQRTPSRKSKFTEDFGSEGASAKRSTQSGQTTPIRPLTPLTPAESPSGDNSPPQVTDGRDEPRRKKGARYNRFALILFLVTQVVYLALGGFSIFMCFAGWDRVSDLDNNGHPGRRSEETKTITAQDIKLKYFSP